MRRVAPHPRGRPARPGPGSLIFYSSPPPPPNPPPPESKTKRAAKLDAVPATTGNFSMNTPAIEINNRETSKLPVEGGTTLGDTQKYHEFLGICKIRVAGRIRPVRQAPFLCHSRDRCPASQCTPSRWPP